MTWKARLTGALNRWYSTGQLTSRQVWELVAPVILGQVFIVGISALNPIIVAPTGTDAINAVSTVEFVNLLLVNVFVALASAGSVVVAQSVGQGSAAGVRHAASATIRVTAIPAVVIGIGLVLGAGPLADALLGSAGAHAASYGAIYLTGLALTYPAQAFTESIYAALRGIARTRPVLGLTILGNGLYLVLATFLVRGGGMGVTGLAVAMVIARYAAAVAAWWVAGRQDVLRAPVSADNSSADAGSAESALAGAGASDTGSWRACWDLLRSRPQRAIVTRVIALGLPFVAEQVFFNGGKLIIQGFIVSMGSLQITINAVASSLIGLGEIIPQALCVAIVPIAGQSIGARQIADARRVIRSFMVTASVVSVLVTGAMMAVFPWLLSLYDTPAEGAGPVFAIFAMSSAARLLGWWSASYLLPSGLRAAGDAMFTTVVATATMATRVLVIWWVAVHLGYGAVGVWAVMVSEWLVRAIAFELRFRTNAWVHTA